MSSGNQFERLFKLWATVAKLVIDGRRSATKVADVLQSIVDEAVDIHPTIYLHDQQKNGGLIEGWNLNKHLNETGLISRAYSLEDEVVKGWVTNPSAYPKKFRMNRVFLWKSIRASEDRIQVACLIWDGRRVTVNWYWLGNDWTEIDPAILRADLNG